MNRINNQLNRREFLNRGTKLALAASTLSLSGKSSDAHAKRGEKLKVALVGTGGRGTSTWGKSLVAAYPTELEMVGLCDINPKRVEYAKRYIGINAPTFAAKDFDKMIRQTKPDAVIITTPDCFHANYAVRAMELGCDAISEKALATEAKQCQALLDTELKTGKKIITTFNVRHMNSAGEIKKILMSDELGRIISAEFYEYLDIHHGASYFRRWHGKARFSGTLLVHKASHHFDQMNWSLDAEPVEVNAFGKVAFYGKNHSFRARNCRSCSFKEKCEFYWDITKSKRDMDLYVKCEDADGYLRDGCVWDNDIDTYDSMTVEVKYNNGVLLSYTLNAFLPYEGQKIAFNGEKGRLDVRLFNRQPWAMDHNAEFRLTKNFRSTKTWTLKPGSGGHGGADEKLKDMLFKPNQPDPLGKMAGSRAGVMSSIIGIAAKKSIETGERIKIADLVDFPKVWQW